MKLAVNQFRCLPCCLIVAISILSGGWTEASAQEWATASLEASPRHMEYAAVKHGNREVECFVAYPEVEEKAHAVVLIHDISGMSDWMRSMADQVAAAGYVAIVPDLLSGMAPNGGGTEAFASIDDARRAIPKLPPEQIAADLDAAADYVSKLPAAKGTFSVAGFCWGGGQALRYATHNPKLSASMVFYGYEPIDEVQVAQIACPVYGFYAQNDARINMSIPDLEKWMDAAKKTFEPLKYPGAGHGFMRHGQDPAGTSENKKARDEAWKRWTELLKQY
jgi:carboxymethylenebutenolidase